jgi:hypothetical protein
MSATKVSSKTVLKGVKKRVTSEATWADDQKASAAAATTSKPEKYILNKSLPRYDINICDNHICYSIPLFIMDGAMILI